MNHFIALLLFVSCFACSQNNKANSTAPVENPEMNQDKGSGGRVGNGGSGVVCRTEDGTKITSIEIYDFYEARALDSSLKFDVEFEPSAAAPIDQSIEFAKYVVETRVRSFDQVLADYLQWRLDNFSNEYLFSDQPLPPTNDILPVRGLSQNCHPVQLAFNRTPDALTSKKFHFWKAPFEHPKFSNTNRAALILHELLYELTASGAAENSQGARALIATIFSGQYLEKFKPLKRYFDFAKMTKMPWVGFEKLPVQLVDASVEPEFYSDDESLRAGHIIPNEFVETPLGSLRVGCAVSFSANGTPWAFSYALDEASGEEMANVSLKNQLNGLSQHRVAPGIKNFKKNGSHWSQVYKQYSCPKSPSKFSVMVAPDSQFYTQIFPALKLAEKNDFFEYKSDIANNIEISGGKITGGLDSRSQAGAKITFSGGGSCEISSIQSETIELHRCTVQLFRNVLSLSVQSVFRDLDSDGYLTIRLADDGKNEWSRYQICSSNILLKPGSLAKFDADGHLRDAVVDGLREETICRSQGGRMAITPPVRLEFDVKGCVVKVY